MVKMEKPKKGKKTEEVEGDCFRYFLLAGKSYHLVVMHAKILNNKLSLFTLDNSREHEYE